MTLYLSGTVADQQEVWALDAPTMGIGRSSRNAIQLADGTVSKEHAEISRQGDRWFLRDLGSRNGTRVNGVEARAALPIVAGDRVEVGHVALTVTDGTPPKNVQYNEATVLSSSLRVKLNQVFERQTRSGASAAHVIHLLAEAGQMLVLPRPLQETADQILLFVEKAIPASRHVLLLRGAPDADPVQIAGRARGGASNQPLAMSRSIMRTVMDECTSVLTGDASTDPRFRAQQSIVAQMVHSAMAVPLFDNEKVLGLIYVDSQDPRVSFNQEQLEVLTLLANMAAVKISNARLLEAEQGRARMAQELATAAEIQRGLLPVAPPRVTGVHFDAFLETCYEVGGDLYDFHVRDDGRVMFVLGDVSGKGMGASLLMSSFLASARVLYDTCSDIGDLARRLGSIMSRSSDGGRFVTGFVGCLDPATGALDYVNAGHPAACLVDGGELRELESNGVPFGILPDFKFETASTQLRPGELLAVFSDGIPEALHAGEFYDDERLRRVLVENGRAPDLKNVREAVLRSVRAFVGDDPRTDDITLLLLRREGGPPGITPPASDPPSQA